MHSHSHNRIKKHPTNKHRRCFFSLLAVLSLVGHTSHTNVLGDADLLTAITVVAVEVATTGEVLLVPAGAGVPATELGSGSVLAGCAHSSCCQLVYRHCFEGCMQDTTSHSQLSHAAS